MGLASQIPKLHLHCHLEGTLRAPTFVELAAKYGVPLRYRPSGRQTDAWVGKPDRHVDPADPYRFRDFQDFLLTFAAASRALQQSGDYARLAREFVEDALAQNVVYGELFVSPSVWTFFNPSLDVRETMAALVAELRAARPAATFRLIVDLTRNFGAESALRTAQMAARMTDLDVVGVGLGGDEARFPAPLFADAFDYARAQGLHAVAHAGEADGAHSVRDAVECLGAERIGHGIHALRDPAVLALLAQRGVALEICPTSNVLTATALAEHPHPHVSFERAGCTVVIDADDPAMFGTSIQREYEIVEASAGSDALVRYVYNAVEASFASPAEKADMRASVNAALTPTRALR